MPYKAKNDGGVSKGKPSQTEKDKSEVKEVNSAHLEQTEELENKYVDEDGNPDADQVWVTNRNRNTDKPDIDKPTYGSSK
ncbi:MAG: hypothetical protein M3421_13305 [Bacteroidota bacterium]|nr:hypothetical protein [Bacteroidota bacterium]